MRAVGVGNNEEFDELVGDIAKSMPQDTVSLAALLYNFAEEKRKDNLIMKELNAKLDLLMNKISDLEAAKPPMARLDAAALSERDHEVLGFVSAHGRVCADQLQAKLKYRGKNAASARLSKLFHEGVLVKEYAGRRVYYKLK